MIHDPWSEHVSRARYLKLKQTKNLTRTQCFSLPATVRGRLTEASGSAKCHDHLAGEGRNPLPLGGWAAVSMTASCRLFSCVLFKKKKERKNKRKFTMVCNCGGSRGSHPYCYHLLSQWLLVLSWELLRGGWSKSHAARVGEAEDASIWCQHP